MPKEIIKGDILLVLSDKRINILKYIIKIGGGTVTMDETQFKDYYDEYVHELVHFLGYSISEESVSSPQVDYKQLWQRIQKTTNIVPSMERPYGRFLL